MAITRERKEELMTGYGELIHKSQGMILAEFSGLNMAGMTRLRSQLREARGEFHVTKNTIAEIALKQAGLPVPGNGLTGTTAVGFAFEDVPGVARVMVNFARESEFLKIKGGLLGKTALSVEEVTALAELPPLPVLRAQLLGVLNTPARNLAGVIAGSLRQVVNVIKAYAEKDAVEVGVQV